MRAGTGTGGDGFVVAWEFHVPAEAVAAFVHAYGPAGPWVALFRRADGFVETQLLADRAEAGRFVTLDRWRDLIAEARGRFGTARLMRTYAFVADGFDGWEEDAPYDRIVVNASVREIPQPLLDQLKPGGVLVAPLDDGQSQYLMRYCNGRRDDLGPIRFAPLERGLGEEPATA